MKAHYSFLYKEHLRKAFVYLEDKYGYSYDAENFCYSKADINIYITFEPHFVLIQYWIVSEPKFTKLPINLLLQLINEISEPLIEDTTSVEEVIEIYGVFYKQKIDAIAKKLPSLLLGGLKKSLVIGLSTTKLTLPSLLKVNNYQL